MKTQVKVLLRMVLALVLTAIGVTVLAAEGGVATGNAVPIAPFQEPKTGVEFVWVEGGCFMMGSPETEIDRDAEEGPRHEVCLDGYYLGKYEVTVGQFRKFAEESGYRTQAETGAGILVSTGKGWDMRQGLSWRKPGFAQDDKHPVIGVSWNDAQRFVEWASRESGRKLRLPTEAEWEYAARAGTSSSRYWGESVYEACKYANVSDLTARRTMEVFVKDQCHDGHLWTAPVGSFTPNAFGLYDMLGNVWEWVQDRKGPYSSGKQMNPTGPATGAERVARGGAWSVEPIGVRAALRNGDTQDFRSSFLGFRLAMDR